MTVPDPVAGDVTPTDSGAEPAAKPAKRDKHLYQIDFVRLVTFGAVILDHVMLSVTAPTSVAAAPSRSSSATPATASSP